MPVLAIEKSSIANRMAVAWQSSAWSPVIFWQKQAGARPAKSLMSGRPPCHDRHRRRSQPMKNHMNQSRRFRAGFTLVELLTVIAIIAILASLLLPVLSAAKKHAQVVKARTEISQIVQAIQSYNSDYGRYPISPAAQAAALNPVTGPSGQKISGEFTYGASYKGPDNVTPEPVGTKIGGSTILTNNEVIAILMDITNYPNTTIATINTNYQKNPRQVAYLNATMSGDPKLPGVGPDLVYRDPWGNPYVITLNLNDDNKVEDDFYRQPPGANGGPATDSSKNALNGLIKQDDGFFGFHGNVMVWSAGPDGKIDPGSAGNVGVNKDNVLSWK